MATGACPGTGAIPWVPAFGLSTTRVSVQVQTLSHLGQALCFSNVFGGSESTKTLWYHSVIKYMQHGKQTLTPKQPKRSFLEQGWFCFMNLWILFWTAWPKRKHVLSSAPSARFPYGVLALQIWLQRLPTSDDLQFIVLFVLTPGFSLSLGARFAGNARVTLPRELVCPQTLQMFNKYPVLELAGSGNSTSKGSKAVLASPFPSSSSSQELAFCLWTKKPFLPLPLQQL